MYQIAQQWVVDALNLMGHGQIVGLSPKVHDEIMANIQFLTHSFFLVAADLVRRSVASKTYRRNDIPEFLWDIMEMSQRILSGSVHVYQGVAIDNPANDVIFAQWKRKMRSIGAKDLAELMARFVRSTSETSEAHFTKHGISRKNQQLVQTPVSSVNAGVKTRVFAGTFNGFYRQSFDG